MSHPTPTGPPPPSTPPPTVMAGSSPTVPVGPPAASPPPGATAPPTVSPSSTAGPPPGSPPPTVSGGFVPPGGWARLPGESRREYLLRTRGGTSRRWLEARGSGVTWFLALALGLTVGGIFFAACIAAFPHGFTLATAPGWLWSLVFIAAVCCFIGAAVKAVRHRRAGGSVNGDRSGALPLALAGAALLLIWVLAQLSWLGINRVPAVGLLAVACFFWAWVLGKGTAGKGLTATVVAIALALSIWVFSWPNQDALGSGVATAQLSQQQLEEMSHSFAGSSLPGQNVKDKVAAGADLQVKQANDLLGMYEADRDSCNGKLGHPAGDNVSQEIYNACRDTLWGDRNAGRPGRKKLYQENIGTACTMAQALGRSCDPVTLNFVNTDPYQS